MCTARAPYGIHLAYAAHGVGFTAPLFLYTCYSQEVEVVLNDDLILSILHGLLFCILYTSDDNIIDACFRKQRGIFHSFFFFFCLFLLFWPRAFTESHQSLWCSSWCGTPSSEHLCSLYYSVLKCPINVSTGITRV